MARKKKAPPAPASKAYLVSFGDTMTALLAFFIVINSLSKDQTGANLHSGTGSFVSAVSSIGIPGTVPGQASKLVNPRDAPSPIYALSENLKKDGEDSVGPDPENNHEKVIDRDKESYQRFLYEIERVFELQQQPSKTGQIAFDSFEPFDLKTGSLSKHAIQLAAETVPLLQNPDSSLEIIVWVPVPSNTVINKMLIKSEQVKKEIESKFWTKSNWKSRLRITVKPWLFTDAKRPVITFVVAKFATG